MIGVKRGQGVGGLRRIVRQGLVDFDARSSRRIGRARLFAVAMAFALAGCASDGNQAPEQEIDTDLDLYIVANLDGKPAMKLTDRKTGVSVSTDDTCQAYK